jgi:acyl-CoA thioesterase II
MSERGWAAGLRNLSRDGDTFTAQPGESDFGRLFGGLVLANGLAAAAETVAAEMLPQSLHGYFISAGQPGIPIQLDVARLRDGRAFANRRVTASQDGKVILEMLVSFHVEEQGEDWHPPAPPRAQPDDAQPVVRPPEMQGVFEMRTMSEATMFAGPPYWIRVVEPVADDPITQACVLTYLSDMGLMAAARPRDMTVRPEMMEMSPEEQRPLMRNAASLDHAVWFHRPYDPNAWHRYEANKLNSNDATGLVQGALYDADGVLVATTAQEALWRI